MTKTPLSGSFSSDDGVTFGYETTNLPDKEDNATVSYSSNGTNGSGTITCPTGAVLHVKAVPHGQVTFHGENNIDLAGITATPVTTPNTSEYASTSVTTTNARTFNITNSTKLHFAGGQEPSGTYDDVTSTRGPNFGHNLSLYKVRYTCNNSRIIYANLKNQWIRDYIGGYSRYKVNYKPLILRNGTLAKKSPTPSSGYNPYSAYWTYGFTNTKDIDIADSDSDLTLFNKLTQNYLPNFRDTCCKVENVRKVMIGPVYGERYNHGTGGTWDILFTFYGAKGDCQFWNVGHGKQIWLYQRDNTGDAIIANGEANFGSDNWAMHNVTLRLDGILKFNRKTSNDSNTRKVQIYLKNGMEKELILDNPTPYVLNAPYSTNSSGVVQNSTIKTYLEQNGDSEGKGGIYLVKLPSNLSTQIVAGDYICFNGDGDLDVIVAPLPGTIKFGDSKHPCPNEDQTVHELYKEYNFCLEPSQMTDNKDGTQSVTFTITGDVTVTATYEIKQKTQVTVTKPSNVAFATINITGHKKEMEWRTSVSQVTGYPCVGDGFRFDGTRMYYINHYKNNGNTINYSDNFGVTWKSLSNSLNIAARTGDLPNTISFKCNNHDIYLSYDNGGHYIQKTVLPPVSDKDTSVYAGFKWSRNASATVKYMILRNKGDVGISDDGFNWAAATRLTDATDAWYNGVIHVNGKWWTANSSLYYLHHSIDGITWDRIQIPFCSLGIAYGSNLAMILIKEGDYAKQVATSREEFQKVNLREKNGQGLNLTDFRSICYANGNFIIGRKGPQIAYTTFHDGVMWKENGNTKEQIVVPSRDIDHSVSGTINTEENNSTVLSTFTKK